MVEWPPGPSFRMVQMAPILIPSFSTQSSGIDGETEAREQGKRKQRDLEPESQGTSVGCGTGLAEVLPHPHPTPQPCNVP